MTDDDLKQDGAAKSSFSSRKRNASTSKSKTRKRNKGVFERNVAEVNPNKLLDSKADGSSDPLFTETTGPGPIPPALKDVPETRLLGNESERVNVRNLWPSRMIVRGTPSGEAYEFSEAGRVLSVRSVDVQYLLGFNRSDTRGCCGSSGEKRKFEVA